MTKKVTTLGAGVIKGIALSSMELAVKIASYVLVPRAVCGTKPTEAGTDVLNI